MALLLLYAFLSIFFSFLCSILEAAFLSFTPSFIGAKKSEGKSYAKDLERFKENVDRPLIAILTINTIAHTVGAILVGVQAEKIYPEGGSMVGVVSAIMTLAILVLSEIIPKTIGAKYWKSLGKFTATTLKLFVFPLKYTGILWLMMQITRLIGSTGEGSAVTREEYLYMTNAAHEEEVLLQNETTLIKNVLLFQSVKAERVMTPFSVAKIANENTPIKTFFEKNPDLIFSRIPVYENNANNISGFVLKDDVLESIINGKGEASLSSIKKEVHIVERDKPIADLLEIMVNEKSHIAIVIDPFGNNVGLITVEDILETLLGVEIMDESDKVPDMQMLAKEALKKRRRK
jgi:CBS domain containing-hemolysin-like protein